MLIKEVLKEFLEEQKKNISARTYKEYDEILYLFEYFLDGYAWNSLNNCDEAFNESRKKSLTFIDIYDHTYIFENVNEFLDYFIPRKYVGWGNEFVLKKCPKVIRKLLKWMRSQNLLNKTDEEIKEECTNQIWEESLEEMGFLKDLDY